MESIYNYQRVILNAFTEVINRMSMVQNYSRSIEIKKQQLASLEASVDVAGKLFQTARVEYIDVLLAQRDLLDARMVLIETKKQQLSAIVNTYQALGGGDVLSDPALKQSHLPGGFRSAPGNFADCPQPVIADQKPAGRDQRPPAELPRPRIDGEQRLRRPGL